MLSALFLQAKRLELESVHPALAAAAAKAAVNEQRLKRILHEFMPSAKAKVSTFAAAFPFLQTYLGSVLPLPLSSLTRM